jgi:hypothetical protein
MKLDRNTLLVLVACAALGYWLASSPDRKPQPLEDRPVLRWIVKTAKTLLWVAVFVEPAPPEPDARHIVKAPAIGDDGYAVIDHGKGW